MNIKLLYYIKQKYIRCAYISTNSKIYNILQAGWWEILLIHILSWSTSGSVIVVFKIPFAVKKADGANSPFTISSSISLEELCNTIADKLGRHDASIIQLQYKLSYDKAKALATSICDNNELQIFIKKMRALLVPPLLANEKPSKCAPPKNCTAYFEDATMEAKMMENSGGKRKTKEVHMQIY